MSTRTITKVIQRAKPNGTIKEYEYTYEVPVKTGKRGRKLHPNRRTLRALDMTDEEAKKLLDYLATLRDEAESTEDEDSEDE